MSASTAERYAHALGEIAEIARTLRCDCFYPDEHAEFGSEPCAKHRLLNLLDSILDMEPPR